MVILFARYYFVVQLYNHQSLLLNYVKAQTSHPTLIRHPSSRRRPCLTQLRIVLTFIQFQYHCLKIANPPHLLNQNQPTLLSPNLQESKSSYQDQDNKIAHQIHRITTPVILFLKSYSCCQMILQLNAFLSTQYLIDQPLAFSMWVEVKMDALKTTQYSDLVKTNPRL